MIEAEMYGMMLSAKIAMRSTAPPENMLNRPSTPLLALLEASAAAPPGRCRAAGCRCRAGRRSSAPRVNQIRFLSSSALAKAPKLMFAASCSAADAMVPSSDASSDATLDHASGGLAIARGPPPIFNSMWAEAHAGATTLGTLASDRDRAAGLLDRLARADFDAPATSKASFAVSSPSPRIFTPSARLRAARRRRRAPRPSPARRRRACRRRPPPGCGRD